VLKFVGNAVGKSSRRGDIRDEMINHVNISLKSG
jgi:hypothetical protein